MYVSFCSDIDNCFKGKGPWFVYRLFERKMGLLCKSKDTTHNAPSETNMLLSLYFAIQQQCCVACRIVDNAIIYYLQIQHIYEIHI